MRQRCLRYWRVLFLPLFLIHIVCQRFYCIIIFIIIIIIYSLEFFTSALADCFHWSLSDSKSPQVSRSLLSILAVLNNVVVWMVSTRPPTSKSSSPFSNPLVTIPNAPITIGIIVTCMFHRFFNSLARSRYFIIIIIIIYSYRVFHISVS